MRTKHVLHCLLGIGLLVAVLAWAEDRVSNAPHHLSTSQTADCPATPSSSAVAVSEEARRTEDPLLCLMQRVKRTLSLRA